jgi:Protein of unknown function (DUF2844)
VLLWREGFLCFTCWGCGLVSLLHVRWLWLQGRPKLVWVSRYSLHEFTTADGVHVREFVSLSGTVFAVAWSGPDIPDLKVLLGSYHADYLAATETPQANRRAVVVNNERVVMRMNALPRGFIGGAHLPGQLPAGVSSQELR